MADNLPYVVLALEIPGAVLAEWSLPRSYARNSPEPKGMRQMSNDNLFVERRTQRDYAVRRPNSERASAVESTQAKAIARARQLNPDAAIHVERVRHTTQGGPDKWRKP